MALFKEIKQSVTPLEVLERYGFRPIQKGHRQWLLCPFHSEKTPSMLISDSKIHCFGCAWHGSAIDFIAEYYHISPIEAAKKIASDFNIAIEDTPQKNAKLEAAIKQKEEDERLYQAYQEASKKTLDLLTALNRQYTKIKSAVKSPTDLETAGIEEAYHYQELVNYWLDILTYGSTEEIIKVIQEVQTWIKKIKQ